jgi:dihydrodipicolinate synthase/N-acetylneuraminate lyase
MAVCQLEVREQLKQGLVIPAHPLALNSQCKLDERRQRALTRYYLAAGAGGIAVAVHTTQFAIRDTSVGLLKPVLELAAEEARSKNVVKIAGVCGELQPALAEAELAKSLHYHAALLSLAALRNASVPQLLDHARAISDILPVIGFYLQPAVGGRLLPYEFWREFAEIPNVVAIKIAPFNRYQTLDVVRAVLESGRGSEIALYTGNDDNIISDLLTEFDFGGGRTRIVGGLLGHWAVWTKGATSLLAETKQHISAPATLLTVAQQVTDMNAAIFDARNQFRGCIAGIHEVLRRQGLLEGRWCLDPAEDLSPGQAEEISRVCAAYPHLCEPDDKLIRENLDAWLRP